MRVGHNLTIGMLMLAACGHSSDAAAPKQQPRQSAAAPKRFDISGVSVGDSLAAATATLRQQGFTTSLDTGEWSFDDWVEASRAKAAGRVPSPKANGPRRLHARKGAEYIYADIKVSADGGLLESVTYKAPANGRPAAALVAEVTKRYASGAQLNPTMNRICAASEPDCRKSNPQESYVQYSAGSELQIALYPGFRQMRQWTADFNAAMRKRLGPVPRPSRRLVLRVGTPSARRRRRGRPPARRGLETRRRAGRRQAVSSGRLRLHGRRRGRPDPRTARQRPCRRDGRGASVRAR